MSDFLLGPRLHFLASFLFVFSLPLSFSFSFVLVNLWVMIRSRRGGRGAHGWWGCLHRPWLVNSCSFDCIFVSEAVCKGAKPMRILCGILRKESFKKGGQPDGKPHYVRSHASARGRSERPDARGKACLAPPTLGDHLSSADGSAQSRGHCKDGGRLALDRAPRHCYLQARGSGCHRDPRERRAASPTPHPGTRTRLPPAILGPRRPRRDGNSS